MTEHESHRWPVSIKGVVLRDGNVVLIRNEREEWELPGGKLDPDESPERCVAREIEEELGILGTVGQIVDSWVYPVRPDATVLIVTYGFFPRPFERELRSPEGREVGLFSRRELADLLMPDGYRRSIEAWMEFVATERRC